MTVLLSTLMAICMITWLLNVELAVVHVAFLHSDHLCRHTLFCNKHPKLHSSSIICTRPHVVLYEAKTASVVDTEPTEPTEPMCHGYWHRKLCKKFPFPSKPTFTVTVYTFAYQWSCSHGNYNDGICCSRMSGKKGSNLVVASSRSFAT